MPPTPASPARRALLPLAALLAATLAGCGSTTTANPNTATGAGAAQQHQPVATTEADWKGVTDALGRTGKFGDNNTVYRIALPRTDLHVTSRGVAIKPGLSLGGYAALAEYHDGVLLMGDLIVTEDELPKVTDALHAHGIEQTALHKHLLAQDPPIWWTHIHGMGQDPVALAQGLKAALDATAIPPATAGGQQPPVDLDTAGIDSAVGRKGDVDVVELHNHTLAEQPRLFYAHFWAVDDAVTLARALRTAVDATNAKPAN